MCPHTLQASVCVKNAVAISLLPLFVLINKHMYLCVFVGMHLSEYMFMYDFFKAKLSSIYGNNNCMFKYSTTFNFIEYVLQNQATRGFLLHICSVFSFM